MLDTLPLIKSLKLDHVDKEGYASLRCNWMHCPKAQVEPVLGHIDDFWQIKGLFASAWTEFFPNEPVPAGVTGPCCAQFAVTREAVQRLPIDKYEQIRQWIWTLEVPSDQASMKSGLVLEYLWHILFGKPAYYCPPAKECYCEKFGLCDLECEREGWCLGRIWQNPQKNPVLSLPKPIPVSVAISLSRQQTPDAHVLCTGRLARGRAIKTRGWWLFSLPGLGEESGRGFQPLITAFHRVGLHGNYVLALYF